jgi:prepilin-type N-terminal cleavage/methylation domain-containing protein
VKKKTKIRQIGFTLIEVIITLVVLAILAAMMVPYFGASFIQSGTPVSRLNTSMSINIIMEKITAQFSQYAHWRPNTVYASGTIILPTTPNRNGYKYSTNAGGTSGATEPGSSHPWPQTIGGTVTDGTIVWTRHADCAPVLDASRCPTSPGCNCPSSLHNSISAELTDQTNSFGSYRVIQNRFIKFDATNTEVNIDGSPSDPAYGRYLKVTIALPLNTPNRTAETLTTLFVMR